MAEADEIDKSNAPLPAVLQEAIGKFSGWAKQHLQAEQDNSKITAPLYHYTDGRGLKGIIESGRMWFTDYRHLNDPSELTHGIDMAHDVARLMATGADGRIRLFLENFKSLFRHENFAATLEFFIACFSRARDDLGQWRTYADNGRGFAIGFSPRMFKVVDKPLPDRLPEFVGPVRYDLNEVCGRHGAALEEAVAIFLDAVNKNADLVRDKAVGIPFMDQFVREIIAQSLIWNCLTSKHPAYEHEQEVRLLIMGTPASLAPHIATRLRGSEIVPYNPFSEKRQTISLLCRSVGRRADETRSSNFMDRRLGDRKSRHRATGDAPEDQSLVAESVCISSCRDHGPQVDDHEGPGSRAPHPL